MGAGGTIPFMAMLGARFPKTQFFITGVLGPQANAHGPNEFLHVEYAKKLTACVSLVLADHARTLGEQPAAPRRLAHVRHVAGGHGLLDLAPAVAQR